MFADSGDDRVELAGDVDLGVAGAANANVRPLGGACGELELAEAAQRSGERADPAAGGQLAGSVVAQLERIGIDGVLPAAAAVLR